LGDNISVLNRKIGWGHDRGQDAFNEFIVKWAAVQPDVGFLTVEGPEKREAHYMIPVSMGEDEIEIKTFFFGQLVAQSANTGSRIDNNDITALSPNFHAGRVAPVF
jgi:hypothetical protein